MTPERERLIRDYAKRPPDGCSVPVFMLRDALAIIDEVRDAARSALDRKQALLDEVAADRDRLGESIERALGDDAKTGELAADVAALREARDRWRGMHALAAGYESAERDAWMAMWQQRDEWRARAEAAEADRDRLRDALRGIRDGEAPSLTGAQHLAALALE